MKCYTSLLTALTMIMTSFHVHGMERVTTSIQPTNQISKKFSTLRKTINEFTKGNPKADEPFIVRTIEEMREAGILNKKDYYYDYVHNKKTKPYIIRQFFTHFPQQICPELQSIVNHINNDTYDREDFITILSTIKTTNEATQQYIDQIGRIIKNTEEASAFKNKVFNLSDITMDVIHKALNAICSNLNEEHIAQKEDITTSTNIKQEIFLLSKIKIQQNLLGDLLPIEESINSPYHFAFFFSKIAEKSDPKNESAMKLPALYKQRLEAEAINSINAIISKYPLISEQLQLIEERFHKNSVSLLRKTVIHNQHILERHPELLAHSQQIIIQEQDISKEELPKLSLEPGVTETNIPSQEPFQYSIKSTSKKQPQSIKREIPNQNSKQPSQIQNPLIRLVFFAQSSINNAANAIYSGIVWILAKINIFKQQ